MRRFIQIEAGSKKSGLRVPEEEVSKEGGRERSGQGGQGVGSAGRRWEGGLNRVKGKHLMGMTGG